MKEYSIYFITGGGKPYNLNTFKTIEDCKLRVYELITEYKEKNKLYYLDNDFYNNEYKLELVLNNKRGIYFKIIERDISSWHDYSELNKRQKNFFNYELKIYLINMCSFSSEPSSGGRVNVVKEEGGTALLVNLCLY